jgi:hypothetical protein
MDDIDGNDLLDTPDVLKAWLDAAKDSLKLNATRNKKPSELNTLVWNSFTQEFTLDPKTLDELLTLDPLKHKPEFKRHLAPELAHWNGTKIHFLHLGFLQALLPLGNKVGYAHFSCTFHMLFIVPYFHVTAHLPWVWFEFQLGIRWLVSKDQASLQPSENIIYILLPDEMHQVLR